MALENCTIANDLMNTTFECNEYQLGGITNIWLLDKQYFQKYKFDNDGRYDRGWVDTIYSIPLIDGTSISTKWIQIQASEDALYTEQFTDDRYVQELSTFLARIDEETISEFLTQKLRSYIIIIRTKTDQFFTWGDDVGASLNWDLTTGDTENSLGYNIRLSSNSNHPMFELNPEFMDNMNEPQIDYYFVPRNESCEIDNGQRTGFAILLFALRAYTDLSGIVRYLDKDLIPVTVSGNKISGMYINGYTPSTTYDWVGTYNAGDVLKGDVLTKYQNYVICPPQGQSSIQITPNPLILFSNRSQFGQPDGRFGTVNIKAYNAYTLTYTPSNLISFNRNQGGAGIETLNVGNNLNQSGNTTVTATNTWTGETVQMQVWNTWLRVYNTSNYYYGDPSKFDSMGEARTYNVYCNGGNAQFSITSKPDWCNVTINQQGYNGSITIQALANVGDLRQGEIVIRHNDCSDEYGVIVIQQDRDGSIVIPPFDWLIFQFNWTSADGRDLDQASYFTNTGIPIDDSFVPAGLNYYRVTSLPAFGYSDRAYFLPTSTSPLVYDVYTWTSATVTITPSVYDTLTYKFVPNFDTTFCYLNGDSKMIGYKIAMYALRYMPDGTSPADEDGNDCSISLKQQACLTLNGQTAPAGYTNMGTYEYNTQFNNGGNVYQTSASCPNQTGTFNKIGSCSSILDDYGIGFGQGQSAGSGTISNWLQWGGDNTSSGLESGLIQLPNVINDKYWNLIPDIIELKITGQWYGTDSKGKANYTTLNITAYEGGTPSSVQNYTWVINGGTLVATATGGAHCNAIGIQSCEGSYRDRNNFSPLYLVRINKQTKAASISNIYPDTGKVCV